MIHTPERSKRNLALLNQKCKVEFDDVSYKNDSVDSVHNEEYGIKIMLPNSDRDDMGEEKYNTFAISLDNDTSQEANGYNSEVFSLEGVVKEVNGLLLAKTPYPQEEPTMANIVLEKMKNGVAHFFYRKKDGSIRETFGTIPKYNSQDVDKLLEKAREARSDVANFIREGEDDGAALYDAASGLLEGLKPFGIKAHREKKPTENVTYYDIEAQGWRVYHPDTIVNISGQEL